MLEQALGDRGPNGIAAHRKAQIPSNPIPGGSRCPSAFMLACFVIVHSPATIRAHLIFLLWFYNTSLTQSSPSQAWFQSCLLQMGSFHPFSICLCGGSQQPPVQNLAASRVEHSFPGTSFEHPPYPRLPSRGWDSSGVCLARARVLSLLLRRFVTLYKCFRFLGLRVLYEGSV